MHRQSLHAWAKRQSVAWPCTWTPTRGAAGRRPGLAPKSESQTQAISEDPPRSMPGNRTLRPFPVRSPPPAAQPSAAPCRRGKDPATWAVPVLAPPTPRLRIGHPRSLQAVRLPPPDWLRPSAEAPPIFPGPLITRLLALPGPGSQPRAFLYGLQRREVRHDRVGWVAGRWHRSTPWGAGVPGCPGPSASPQTPLPGLSLPEPVGPISRSPFVAGPHPRSGLTPSPPRRITSTMGRCACDWANPVTPGQVAYMETQESWVLGPWGICAAAHGQFLAPVDGS